MPAATTDRSSSHPPAAPDAPAPGIWSPGWSWQPYWRLSVRRLPSPTPDLGPTPSRLTPRSSSLDQGGHHATSRPVPRCHPRDGRPARRGRSRLRGGPPVLDHAYRGRGGAGTGRSRRLRDGVHHPQPGPNMHACMRQTSDSQLADRPPDSPVGMPGGWPASKVPSTRVPELRLHLHSLFLRRGASRR